MNVIRAFLNLVEDKYALVGQTRDGLRRANTQGDSLEEFVKDAFAGSLEAKSFVERERKHAATFSYTGNSNNPPDALVRGGVAIETKKLNGSRSEIQLNSSHPKDVIYSSDSRITEQARTAETWKEKDLVYAIGNLAGGHLKRLWMVYGDCIAASAENYESTWNIIAKLISEDSGLNLANSNELASVRGIDPQDRTKLRVRGMWILANPNVLFEELTSEESRSQFYVLLKETTYGALPESDRRELESLTLSGLQNRIVNIPDPNNSDKEIEARFIGYEF
jgi:hypothetical protein